MKKFNEETKDEVVEDTAEVVDEPEEVEQTVSTRQTTKPKAKQATFKVLRSYTWGGTKYTIGEEHTVDETTYEAMLQDLNARTDRLVFVQTV